MEKYVLLDWRYPRPVRAPLHVALLWAARAAVRLAARLEEREKKAREKRAERAVVRAYVPARRGGVGLVEAVVVLAVAAYFVVGLVGVFVS
jgi:hypothetical protein